jgi:hypothetical protein
MNRNDVKYFQYNRFSQSTLPKLSLPGENYPKFTLGLWGGWSYRTAKVPSNIARELQDYITKLKSGTNYGLGIAYYFDAKWGFGFLYSRFKSENRMENVGIEIPDEGILVGTMADNIKIHYYAPVLFYRNYSPNAKAVVYSSFSMGYLEYTNNAIMIFDATLRGATLGYGLSLGIDVLVSKQVALGAEVLLIGGNLQQYTIEMMGQKETIKLDKENYENLSRIEFCLGLKLYLD